MAQIEIQFIESNNEDSIRSEKANKRWIQNEWNLNGLKTQDLCIINYWPNSINNSFVIFTRMIFSNHNNDIIKDWILLWIWISDKRSNSKNNPRKSPNGWFCPVYLILMTSLFIWPNGKLKLTTVYCCHETLETSIGVQSHASNKYHIPKKRIT